MSPQKTKSAMTETLLMATAATISARSSSGGSASTTRSASTLRIRRSPKCSAGTGRWRESSEKAVMTATQRVRTGAAVFAKWRAGGSA